MSAPPTAQIGDAALPRRSRARPVTALSWFKPRRLRREPFQWRSSGVEPGLPAADARGAQRQEGGPNGYAADVRPGRGDRRRGFPGLAPVPGPGRLRYRGDLRRQLLDQPEGP